MPLLSTLETVLNSPPVLPVTGNEKSTRQHQERSLDGNRPGVDP